MPNTVETARKNELLKVEIQQMEQVFGNDYTLVLKAAEEHGVEATYGSVSKPLEKGNYNQRVPDQSEIDMLLNAEVLLVHCMDRRCSTEHAEEMKADVSISIAGGGAQPENSHESDPAKKELRLETLTNFLYALHSLGKLKTIILSGHDGVCGGINYLTDGKAVEANRQGQKNEQEFVAEYLRQTANLLIEKGIPENEITMNIAIISRTKSTHGHDEESYSGKIDVPFLK